ncbi:hypothetical protein GALL_440010 [mine drainage metagenome]|uniref:Uncharacterized protein n=1 Tax=mine drainage metagenome TaxID=410659 RepID=A0A1J5QA23_9ZZZZ
MHLIVELGARADRGIADGATVNRRIRAQLHIIAQAHRAQRMDARPALRRHIRARAKGFAHLLCPRFLRRDKREPVAPNHTAGVADKTVANHHPRHDAHAVQDQRIGPDLGTLGNRDMAGDTRPRADTHTAPDKHKRRNRGTLTNLGAGVDHTGGMNTGRNLRPGVKHARQARHRKTRTRHKDRGLQPQRAPIGPGPQHRCPCRALGEPFGIFRVHRQRQIIDPRRGWLCGTANNEVKVALGLRVQRLGNIFYAVAHHNSDAARAISRDAFGIIPEPRPIPPRPSQAPRKSRRRGHRCHADTPSAPSPARWR